MSQSMVFRNIIRAFAVVVMTVTAVSCMVKILAKIDHHGNHVACYQEWEEEDLAFV